MGRARVLSLEDPALANGVRLEREPGQSLGASLLPASVWRPDYVDMAGGISPGLSEVVQGIPVAVSWHGVTGIAEALPEPAVLRPVAQKVTEGDTSAVELEDARRTSGLVKGLVHEACSGVLISLAFTFGQKCPIQLEEIRQPLDGLKLNLGVLQEVADFEARVGSESNGKPPSQWLRETIAGKLGQSWSDERGEPPNSEFAAETARLMRELAKFTEQLIETARRNEATLRVGDGGFAIDSLLANGEGFGRLVEIFAALCEGKEVSTQPRPVCPRTLADRTLSRFLPEYSFEAEGVPETGAIDPGLAEMVWSNLVRNARDHGDLPIKARLGWEKTPASSQGEMILAVANQAKLVLTDVTLGEHMDRIWQPGYSTKSLPSGLGLPLAQWAAERLGGQVEAEFLPESASQDPASLTGTIAGRFVATARLPMGLG